MSITTPLFILITIILAQTSEVLRCSFSRMRGDESPLTCLRFSWTVIILAATGSLISLISHFIPAGSIASSVAGISLMVIIDVLIIKIMFDFATKIFSWECPESGLKRLWCWSSKVVTWALIISVVAVLLYKIDSVQANIENSLLIDNSSASDENHFVTSEYDPSVLSMSPQIQLDNNVLIKLPHSEDSASALEYEDYRYHTYVLDRKQYDNFESAGSSIMSPSDEDLTNLAVYHNTDRALSLGSRASPVFRSRPAIPLLTALSENYAYH